MAHRARPEHVIAELATRTSPAHLRQRLGIEGDREARVFGQGINFFHIENWYSIHAALRFVLRATMLHGRGQRNALSLAVRHNGITLPRLPAAFEGFRILHLSDLHLDMLDGLTHALVERVRGIDHDVCVLTGDYRARTTGSVDGALEGLQALRMHLDTAVYAVLGNHDSIRMVPAMEAMGMRVLLNEALALRRGDQALWLAGIDDPHYYRADNLEKTCERIPEDAVSVLLAHSPEIFRNAAHAGFDVMLCGHTHGGQICLPGGVPLYTNARCPRALCAGAWRFGDLIGYTSAGSGVSVSDVRFNCPPEITVHRLTRKGP